MFVHTNTYKCIYVRKIKEKVGAITLVKSKEGYIGGNGKEENEGGHDIIII